MLTYDNKQLLMEDPFGIAQQWLDESRLLPIDIFGDYPQAEGHGYTGGCQISRVPIPNYPADPVPRINTLYWPTGASRWAYGLFLATSTTVNQLAFGEAKTLLMQADNADKKNTSVSATMYALTPIQLSSAEEEPDGTSAERLYLLPLVDARFYWQWRHCGELTVSDSTTWANVISSLGTQLGATLSTSGDISSDYFKPDSDAFSANQQNAATMLDAVAHSIGRRVVVRTNGSVYLKDWTTSKADLTNNIAGTQYKPWWITAGGDASAIGTKGRTPEKLVVSFPKWLDGARQCTNWTVEKSASTYNASGVSGTEKVIFSTARALFEGAGSNPENNTDINPLAAQIATDYYASLERSYHYTFGSIKPWEPVGYDNFTLWSMACKPDGTYECLTRVHSMPFNFGVEEQLHATEFAESGCNCGNGVFYVEADEDITACSSGTCTLLDDSCARIEGETVEVWNGTTNTATSGNRLLVGHGEGNWKGRLVAINEDCPSS